MPEQLELFRLPPPQDHGTGSRHLILAGRIVAYDLRRDRRRLAMRIDESGLHVGAPRGMALVEIEAFVLEHATWVLQKIDELVGRGARRHLPIRDGASLPVLGEPVQVRVTTGGNRGYWQDGELWLAARPAADLSLLARRALQRRALEYFRPRLEAAVARLGRPMPALALSSARTRWGSCSPRNGIRLNWRLIHLPSALIDYVIAHEAAHLVEMNHGPRFWQVVERLYPDWQTVRQALRQQGAELPLI